MATLYLVRHGESVANVRHVFSNGRLDLPLTGLGREQARRAAAWLADRGIAHVFSAPLLRARQTAEIIAGHLGAGTTVLPDLDEVRVGNLDGRDDPESWAIYDRVMARWYAGDEAAAFPGGERLGEALARYRGALREIGRRYPDGVVAAVTHGGIQLTVLPRLCPTLDGSARTLPNVAITTLEVTPDGFACTLWGSTAHLSTT